MNQAKKKETRNEQQQTKTVPSQSPFQTTPTSIPFKPTVDISTKKATTTRTRGDKRKITPYVEPELISKTSKTPKLETETSAQSLPALSSSSSKQNTTEDLECHETFPTDFPSTSEPTGSGKNKGESSGSLPGFGINDLKLLKQLQAQIWSLNQEHIKAKTKNAALLDYYKAVLVENEGYLAEIKELRTKNEKLEENQSALVEYRLLHRLQDVTIKDLEAKLSKFTQGKDIGESQERLRASIQLSEVDTLKVQLKEHRDASRQLVTQNNELKHQMQELKEKHLAEIQEISTKTSARMALAEEDIAQWKRSIASSIQEMNSKLDDVFGRYEGETS